MFVRTLCAALRGGHPLRGRSPPMQWVAMASRCTPTWTSRRSSLPFGDTACGGATTVCQWEQGSARIGPEASSGVRVFEMRQARRGDPGLDFDGY